MLHSWVRVWVLGVGVGVGTEVVIVRVDDWNGVENTIVQDFATLFSFETCD